MSVIVLYMSKVTTQRWEEEREGGGVHPVWALHMNFSPGWHYINLNISVLLADGIFSRNFIGLVSLQNL